MRTTCAALILLSLVSPALAQTTDTDEVQRLDALFHSAHARSDWPAALDAARKLVELQPRNPICSYNLACALSRAGESDAALKALSRSAELGFDSAATLENDADLEPIRTHAGYSAVLSHVQQNAERRWATFKKRAEHAKVLKILPPAYEPKRAAPLFVVLHGYGATAGDIAGVWKKTAAQRGAILLAPQALSPIESGFQWGRFEEAEYLVLKAIDEVRAAHNIDPQRVILIGFSQGGVLTYEIGLRHADLFTGLIPMAGAPDLGFLSPAATQPDAPETATRPRIYAMVGESDRLALRSMQAADRVLRGAGYATELVTFKHVAHRLPPKYEREFEKAADFVLRP